jgi:hypothetical protein
MNKKRQLNVSSTNPTAALCIYGISLNPDEITRRMGIKPTESFAKGTIFKSRSGKKGLASRGTWILDSDKHINSQDLTDHIRWVLSEIPKHIHRIDRFPGVDDTRLICFYFANKIGGFEMPNDVLIRLEELGLKFQLDIYT